MLAVSLARGISLPTTGPGISARMMWMERSVTLGTSAITNTSTPMPPTQWVKLRQNRMPRPRASISVRMLAPVVVKPETVSKKASTKWGISPEMTKGMAPNSDMRIHAKATTARPSLAYREVRTGLRAPSSSPHSASSAMGIRNGTADSPYSRLTAMGSASRTASVNRIRPITKPII